MTEILCDPYVTRWKERDNFSLVVVQNELFAVEGDVPGTTISIEKYTMAWGSWQMVTELDENRECCSVTHFHLILIIIKQINYFSLPQLSIG